MTRWMRFIVALPALGLAGVRLALLALAVAGAHPFWPWEPLTLSEAVALRDRGEVARMLAEGQDPNGVYEVRRGFLYRRTVRITPLQAAVAAERPEVARLLTDAGARAD